MAKNKMYTSEAYDDRKEARMVKEGSMHASSIITEENSKK